MSSGSGIGNRGWASASRGKAFHPIPAMAASHEASLCYPFGIVADRDGALLVADTFNHRIRVLALE